MPANLAFAGRASRRHPPFAARASFVAALSLVTVTSATAAPSVSLVSFGTVDKVVDITNAGAGDTRLFGVDQDGDIVVLDSAGASLGTFLDLEDRVICCGERGLLGLAFHPDYATNGFFYVNYTRDPDDSMSGEAGEGDTRISRFSRIGAVGSNTADPASEFPILDIPQPFANHNGGDLDFGPDGNLWIPMGDGGAGGDPDERAQDPAELLGKMLRLDVDGGSPYAIPGDNPFIGPDGILDEIWAFGFRNPFRFSFDRSLGDIWIGDVGQGEWEEVDFEPAGSAGGLNYGWDCYEGPDPFETGPCLPIGNYTFPVHAYDQTSPAALCAIIGGFVYRGSQYPAMIGHYFFADACTGDFWSLSPDGIGGFDLNTYGVLPPSTNPHTFGENAAGELFVGSGSTVYQITATAPPTLSCPAMPLTTCRQPTEPKASLLIKNDPADDTKDKVIWKWLKGDITPKTAFGDPLAADYALCIYSGTAVMEAAVPGQASCPTCWTETGSGFKYKVDTPGIQKLILKSGDVAGKAKIILKGKGTGLPATLPTIPVTQPVTVQLINSDNECWEASYSAPATKNVNDLFKDKSD